MHYTGLGHGAYPFWLGPDGASGTTGGPIEVWWSEPKASEKFFHKVCWMGEAGYRQIAAPCYHLFVGTQPNPKSYLYTAAEDFCCLSEPGIREGTMHGPGGSLRTQTMKPAPPPKPDGGTNLAVEYLSSPQSDWMALMTNQGNDSGVSTEFFDPKVDGPAIRYNMALPSTEAVTWFWLLTTQAGHPVQQGEGGFGGSGIEIWHNYNTSSFKATTLDASVFAVPEICKQSIRRCGYP